MVATRVIPSTLIDTSTVLVQPMPPSTSHALVPEAEMQTYSQDLRSMTSGEGVYEMEFARYEYLPPDRAKPLIEAFKKAREEGK